MRNGAGLPVARRHGILTIGNETGYVQFIAWRDAFAKHRRKLASQMVKVTDGCPDGTGQRA